ncbi:alpha/beta fold hydrolase [Massilia sp. TS11]|uniref:alpha/beta fold hydrolase n=1 Tax=Massilia sp. TS11 TaxID=2908003 RepID=UPI001EDA3843|nr:alpha/beta hydrolase [Massilia sp. TS11]MCG2584932.1 alpha/beta hydrolase [Massilia sp. TS11]
MNSDDPLLPSAAMRRRLLGLGLAAPLLAVADQASASAPQRRSGMLQGPHGRIRYEMLGDGPPLLLVAGGPGTSLRSLGTVFDALADRHTLVYFDNIGRGYSDPLPAQLQHSPERDAEDIETVRAGLGFERFALLGHSYGGYPALAYAGRYGQRLSHLVLSSSGCSYLSWQANIDSVAYFIANQYPEVWAKLQALRRDGVKSSDSAYQALQGDAEGDLYWYDLRNAARRPPPGDPRERFRADVYFAMLGDDPEVQVGGAMARFDARPVLQQLRTPLLVTSGRYDRVALPRCALEMVQLAPPGVARLQMFEQSGHAPWIEEETLYLTSLRNFLR